MTNRLPADDIPPPPYSETDIYSNPGDAPSPILSSSSHRQTPYANGRDNNVVVPHSPPSTIDGEIIYTPPLTPRSSSAQQSNFSFAAHSDVDHLTTSSAAAYFDARPPPPQHIIVSRAGLVHGIVLRDDITPDELPYPGVLFGGEEAGRDITPLDWQTFVNYLIPNFWAVSNEGVVDRKMRAEGLVSGGEKVNGNGNGGGNGAVLSEAQLDQIRVGGMAPDGEVGRRQVMEQTVREWNEGFFVPRGVTIRVVGGGGNVGVRDGGDVEEAVNVMPRGWDTSFDQGESSAAAAAAAAAGGGSRSRFARFMPQFGGPGGGGGPRGFGGLGIGGPGGSFRLGGIAVDGDRVSIGKGIVADRNGLRIGSMVADTNGISLNGQPMFGGPPAGGSRGFPPVGGPRGGGFGTWGFGGGRGHGHGHGHDGGPWGRGWGGRGGGRGPWGGRGHWGHDEKGDDDDHDHDHGFGGRGRRGRRRERHHDEPRHRSRSHSASSVSSSSSSASESSIGSLPDYDELRDSQLPVARNHLLAWLHDPNQPITKDQLKEAKQKIKEAKTANINEPANITYDQKAMRKEVKALMKSWRDLKKQQTKLRRQLRRERKQQRRAEKRERRNTRREMKRAAREQKRAVRNGTAGLPVFPGVPFPLPHGSTFPPGGPPNNPFGPRGLFGGAGPFYNPAPQSEGNLAFRDQAQAQTPGAWPADEIHDYDVDAHRASQGKYKDADDIESQLVEKETELFKLHEAIALKNEALAQAQAQGSNRDAGSGNGGGLRDDKQVLAARELGEEIRDLAERMTLLRTEADAEYARELAQMGDA